jgi:hypothetical protein
LARIQEDSFVANGKANANDLVAGDDW